MLALSSIHQHGVCTVAVGGDVGACQGTRPEEGAARPSVAILVSTSLPPSLRTSGHHPCWPGGRAGLGRALGPGCEVTGLLRIQDAGEAPGAVMTDMADQSRRRARPSLHRPSPSPSSLASWLLRGLPCHLSTEQQAAPSQKAPWIMTRPCGNCQSRAPSTVTPLSFLDTRGGGVAHRLPAPLGSCYPGRAGLASTRLSFRLSAHSPPPSGPQPRLLTGRPGLRTRPVASASLGVAGASVLVSSPVILPGAEEGPPRSSWGSPLPHGLAQGLPPSEAATRPPNGLQALFLYRVQHHQHTQSLLGCSLAPQGPSHH